MRWRKLGLVYRPNGDRAWARKYAAFPTVEMRGPEVARVYITSLDGQNFGRGGFVDVEARDPTKVIRVSEAPILDLGPIGDFDDAGANPFALIDFGGKKLVYYQGWQRTLRAPYAIFTGLATGTGDGPFVRWSRTPVLERTNAEPHIRGAPFVINENGRLRMWYVGSSNWSYRGDHLHYNVHIRHAVSTDGIRWEADPTACIVPGLNEYGVGRPVVLHEGSKYRMWYSVRSFERPYTIGYAESEDGLHWARMDHAAGITRSESGWDSEMVCYGYVAKLDGRLTMFYNGNQHGATGFGCAVLESE
jgi:predicted GH43/DUF377 family glycosyl hydrolase